MLVCFLCASDLVISASCLASRLICFCFTSCTFWLRKLQHLVRHLLFFASGLDGSFAYMGFLLKCTLSVLQSRRSGLGFCDGIGLSVLQSQASVLQNARFWDPKYWHLFFSLKLPFFLKNGPGPHKNTGFNKANQKIRPCGTPRRHAYIYMAAGTSAAHILLKNANFPQFYSKTGSKKLSIYGQMFCIFFYPEHPAFSISGGCQDLDQKTCGWGNLKIFFLKICFWLGKC